jgi:hypothetical protein
VEVAADALAVVGPAQAGAVVEALLQGAVSREAAGASPAEDPQAVGERSRSVKDQLASGNWDVGTGNPEFGIVRIARDHSQSPQSRS